MRAGPYLDVHCHLDDERFDPDREEVLQRMTDRGVGRCITAGSDLVSSLKGLGIAQRHPEVFAACGIHPHEAEQAPVDYPDRLMSLLENKKVVAVGEIGLDDHYAFSSKEAQREVLHRQLDLAWSLRLPVILHVRDAHREMLSLLEAWKGRLAGGIIHCYSGTLENARDYCALGLKISFAGSVSFKNASQLREVAAAVDTQSLLVETDSPYLAPVPVRGHRNEPGNVVWVLETVARLQELEPERLAERVRDNAAELFGRRWTG